MCNCTDICDDSCPEFLDCSTDALDYFKALEEVSEEYIFPFEDE
jgi:hypothetical protein